MSSNVELAKAYVTVIPSMEGAQGTITSELSSVLGTAGETAGMSAGATAAGGMASALSKFAVPAAVIAGIGAAGKAVFDVGSDFDAMYDSIKVGTGATGEALDGLEESAKNVLGSVPSSMEDVGQTLADLNTRTGLTGDGLEDLSRQFLNLDEIGQSMDVNSATGMMTAWGVASEDMGGKLDELFVVSQNTGIGMDSLSSAMSANASSMQSLGFSFEETASMAGMLDKAGLDASGMLSKMSKAAVTLAKDGEKPADAYKRVTSEMQGFIDKGDKASAMKLASELFGTKGASQFVQALETGALNIDDMAASLENADGAIASNADNTRSLSESLDIMKNSALTAIEPLASGLFDGLSDAFAAATPYIQEAGAAIGSFFESVSENEDVQQILAYIGEVATDMFNGMKTAAGIAMPYVLGIVKTAWNGIKAAFSVASTIYHTVKSVFNGIKSAIADPVNTARNAVKSAIEAIKGFFSFKVSWPHIPMPHFAVTPSGWKVGDLLKGSIPKLGIEWYAKGGIADGANLIGVGEAGPEAIMPLQGRYMQPFAKAVADNMGGRNMNITINANGVSDPDQFAIELAQSLKRLSMTGAV